MYSALSGTHLGGGRIFCRLYTIELLFTLGKVKKNCYFCQNGVLHRKDIELYFV